MLANDTVSLTSSGSSSKSGYVPFMGNAIELINTGSGKNKNFTAKYSKCCRHTRKNGQQSLKPCLSSYFTPSNITNSGKQLIYTKLGYPYRERPDNRIVLE